MWPARYCVCTGGVAGPDGLNAALAHPTLGRRFFGVLIVPLGVVSITFIIIQPILIGTWCLLCLIAAALMLMQIAYAFNEFVATGQFLLRRKRSEIGRAAGRQRVELPR